MEQEARKGIGNESGNSRGFGYMRLVLLSLLCDAGLRTKVLL